MGDSLTPRCGIWFFRDQLHAPGRGRTPVGGEASSRARRPAESRETAEPAAAIHPRQQPRGPLRTATGWLEDKYSRRIKRPRPPAAERMPGQQDDESSKASYYPGHPDSATEAARSRFAITGCADLARDHAAAERRDDPAGRSSSARRLTVGAAVKAMGAKIPPRACGRREGGAGRLFQEWPPHLRHGIPGSIPSATQYVQGKTRFARFRSLSRGTSLARSSPGNGRMTALTDTPVLRPSDMT